MLLDYSKQSTDSIKNKNIAEKIEKYLISLYKPEQFNQYQGNILDNLDINFQSLIASLENAGVKSPQNLSVFELNHRIEYYKKKSREKNH